MRPDRTELLDRIVAMGERRRRRRRAALTSVGIAIAAVAVGVPLSLAGSGEPDESVVAAGIDRSTTTETAASVDVEHPVFVPTTECAGETCDQPPTPPETETAPEPGPDGLAPGVTSSPTMPPSTSTTTTAACRNSHDPACGPFRWDPQPPANQPLVVTVTVDRTTVAVGEPITITATASDPDGPARFCGILTHAEAQNPACAYPACAEQERFGPWTPPAPEPGDVSDQLVHTYDQAGTYTVSGFAYSHAGPCGPSPYDPYGDEAHDSVTITVTE